MIRIMLGIIIGFFLMFLFIYSGGGETIKGIGKRIERVGTKATQFEKDVKEGKDGALKALGRWKEDKKGE